jgi:uncharacterized protein (DUF2062 family)
VCAVKAAAAVALLLLLRRRCLHQRWRRRCRHRYTADGRPGFF